MRSIGIALMVISTAAGAWTHPVYKCGNSYSDEPCAGGKEVDIRPTEGVHSMSGKKRLSMGVELRKAQRGISAAVQPITGVTPDEMERRIAEDAYQKKGRIRIHREEPQAK